jgi:hypothetical protein
MSEPCIRCGIQPARKHDWLHCEDCYQIVCQEIADAWADDPISRLMREQDVGFVEAVEWLAVERGLMKP